MPRSDGGNGDAAATGGRAGPRTRVARAIRAVQDTVATSRLPLLNGALTRFGVVLALFPLDVMKTRAQMRTAQALPNPLSLLKGRGHLLKNEMHLFRGAPVAVLGAAGAGALSYIVFAALSRGLPAPTATASVASNATTAAAEPMAESANRLRCARNLVASEAVAAAWLVPLEGVKVRVQTGVHSNAGTALRYAVRSPAALYAGVAAHFARELPARALSVAVVAFLAKKLASLSEDTKKKVPRFAETAAAAAIVGAVTTPLDLVRTRVMAQRIGAGSLHNNFLACGLHIARREGVPALFRGLVPRTIYLALSAGLFAAGFEATERTLKERQWLWYRPDVWVEDDGGTENKKEKNKNKA